MAAIGTEKLDFFVPQLLVVTVEFALALWAGYPKNLRHGYSGPDSVTIETQSSQKL
jgi:hypothetical protein